jgi:ComF family protein
MKIQKQLSQRIITWLSLSAKVELLKRVKSLKKGKSSNITKALKSNLASLWYSFRKSLGGCDLCSNPTDKHLLLCNDCLNDLPLFRYQLITGDLLNWPAINKLLPKIHFDHLFCLAPYKPPVNGWIRQFKYNGRFELASLLADLLSKHFLDIEKNLLKPFDLVVSVPVHISKWQSRGYNQAHLLASPIAKHLECAYMPNLIERCVKNINQVGQDGNQRRKNLKGVFKLKTSLPESAKHIVIVDDVVTTGSTASEIAKILKSAGAQTITVMAVSLSLPEK